MTSKTQAIEALIGQLEGGDEVDRCYAAQALGRLQAPTALEPLYRHLQDEDLDVCIDAATALGNIGSDEAVQGLIDALHYHAEVDVKQAAIEGLSKCGGERVAKTLQQLLDRPDDMGMSETEGWDDWWDLQLQAVKALGDNAVAEAAEALAQMIDSDDGQDIDSEILKALVQIGPAGVAQLEQRLLSATPRQRRRFATALAYAESAPAFELLFGLLDNEDADVRTAATVSLAAVRSDSVNFGSERLVTLVGLLNDPSAQVQAAALRGLGQLQLSTTDDAVDQQLLALLDSDDSQVRSAVLRLLSPEIEQYEVIPQVLIGRLQQGLSSDHEEEQRLCCELLARVDQAEVQQQLLALAEDTAAPAMVRRQAIQSLGQQSQADVEVLQVLWRCGQDANSALRHVALQSLQQLNLGQTDTDSDAANSIKDHTEEHSDSSEQAAIPTPLSLLLSALNGVDVEWPLSPEEADNDEQVVETVAETIAETVAETVDADPQRIDLVSIDDEGNEIQADVAAVKAPPGIEQILASVSDAYPAELPTEADPSEPATSLGSTLESITRSNIEATVGVSQELSSDSERILGLVDELPEEFDQFAEVVHSNARSGERMIKAKRRKPDEIAADRRILAARVLGDCGQGDAVQENVVQPLLGCLMDEDANLRREAAESLGRLVAHQPKLPGLSNIMGPVATQLRAGNEEIRLACARTLGALKHKAAIPALLAALDDPDTLVRIQAIRSLTSITLGKGRALTEEDHVVLSDVTPNRVTQAILDCQEDTEIGVRKAVIEALVELRRLELDLLVRLGLEEGGALTLTAARAMKALDPEAATTTAALIKALDQQGDSAIRRLAMQMLQQIHAAEAA